MVIYQNQEDWDKTNQSSSELFQIEYNQIEYTGPIILDKMSHYENGCRKGIGGAPKGRIPWNKGKKGLQIASEEARQKMRDSSARKGKPPHNKGIPMSTEAKAKAGKSMSETRKKKFWSSKKLSADAVLG